MYTLKGSVVDGVLQARFVDEYGAEFMGPVAIHAADVPGNVLRIGFAATGDDGNILNCTSGVAVIRATANLPERVVVLDNWGKPALVVTDGEGGDPLVVKYGDLSAEQKAEIAEQLNGPVV